MRTPNRWLLSPLLTAAVCSGTTILLGMGIVSLDNGVSDPASRGYGRGISVNLSSPNFSFSGGTADSTKQYPGTVFNGLAMPATSVYLESASYDGAVTVVLDGMRLGCGGAQCGGTLRFSSNSAMVPSLPDPGPYPRYSTFALGSSVEMTGTLHLPTGPIAIYGEGGASMKGGYGRIYVGGDPTYWIWGTTYTFSFAEVPEPYSIGLLAVGLAIVLLVHLLVKRFHS